ncbi:hypothetical protein QOZ80_6BG0490270 [Eleusine coracana subsp. coracana]|nr:hypothetical protein QOZ80_6BG0490270 [Eleusine coracana subsp. coracana]
MPTSLRQWWRRAVAAFKDRRSLLLARLRPRKKAPRQHRAVEAAVIRATSHEDRWMDNRAAARVFAWARAPSARPIIVRELARRARRTRCWAVALKALMVAHGLLILRPAHAQFQFQELAGFRDRSSSPAFSAFVRAYYRFLDCRSLFVAARDEVGIDVNRSSDDYYRMTRQLDRITRLQLLLDLLLQIRPCADGMDVPLVLEAMECALIEVFQLYGEICAGVTRFLVSGVPDGGALPAAKPRMSKAVASAGVKMLWRAAEQSEQLSSYLELCRGLGVVNARRLPAAAFDRLRREDVRILERVIMDDVREDDDAVTDDKPEGEASAAPVDVKGDSTVAAALPTTVVTTEWVAFGEEELGGGGAVSCAGPSEDRVGSHWNPFVAAPLDVRESGNLIEL